MDNKKNALYETIKKAHPEWSQKRIYAVTGVIMTANNQNRSQRNATDVKRI